MPRPSLIKQHDITDCGAACLASVAAFYDLRVPIARIRQLASTDQRGSNLKGMVEAAQHLGFQAKAAKGKIESLQAIPKPAIAHVVFENGLHHYVVIYKTTPQKITVMDPADGKLHHYTLEAFGKLWSGALLLLLPAEQFQSRNDKVPVSVRFRALLAPFRGILAEALVGAAVYTLLGLAASIYVQKIIDYVLPEQNRNLMNLMGVIMLVLLGVQLYLGAFKNVFILKIGQRIDANLIMGYYYHLLRLPQRFFDTMRTGEILSRVNDAVKIRVFLNDIAISFAVNVLVLLFAFALMFTYDVKLALVMLLILPFYGITYLLTNRWNKKYQRELMVNAAELESQLVESINSMLTLKTFGLQEFTFTKTESRLVPLFESIYQAGIRGIVGNTLTEGIARVFTIVLLWVGALWVLDRELSAGELLSFYTLIGYFTGAAGSLIGFNKSLQDALIAADRLFEILDLEHERNEGKIDLTEDLIGDIQFRNVSFAYGSRQKVFENLSLQIPKAQITAIIGESGSGKTSLMALLQNLYSYSGNIQIGNYDLQYFSSDSLRAQIAVVPQNIDLLAGTLIENIALGEYEPDLRRVVEVCQAVGLLSFIETLPAGFQTLLGERGVGLSGGQKQRLAIARALYRQPLILLLDEATSALDTESEKIIEKLILKLRTQGKTVILITHRLHFTQFADKIIHLAQGKVQNETLNEYVAS